MPQLDFALSSTVLDSPKPSFGLAPLHPLTPRQRIGYLDTVSEIRCAKPMPGFGAGATYRVTHSTVKVMRRSLRMNLDGDVDDVELNGQEMAVFLIDQHNRPVCFMNEKFMGKQSDQLTISDSVSIDYGFEKLIEHFELPDVPDVATMFPERYAKYRRLVDDLEKFIRLSNPDFSLREWQKDDLARSAIRDGFILGWDTGLGKGLAAFLWPALKAGWDFTAEGFTPKHPILIVTLGDLYDQFKEEGFNRLGLRVSKLTRKTTSIRNGFYCASYTELTGQARVMQLARQFKAIIVDEATKMKGEHTDIGQGIRSLDPEFRAVVTATPIKNRLPDLFSLLWWAAGGKPNSHPGFPYKDTPNDRDWFTQTFMVMERNLTKEKNARADGYSRKFIRPTAEACNLPRLWTITAPMILRRRKCDVGDMVAKIPHRILVPMGIEQQRSYRRIIENRYLNSKGKTNTGAKLSDLRQCAACPDSPNLGNFRSHFDYTPKLAAALSLINTILHRDEQVIVYSAFNEATDALSRYLCDAHVYHMVCDGRSGYDERGLAAKNFKQGKTPVMLAGEGSMAYGHSFSRCNNIIAISKDWAYDLWEQATNRGHRLDSIKDLNLYSILTKGSIDIGVDALLDEKSSSAQLVLDGELDEQEVTDADLVKLLHTAVHDFDNNQDAAVDERQLLAEWPTLRESMRKAA